MKCSVCEGDVADGILEAGVPRHITCEPPSERKTRVTLSLTRNAIATFERLGKGNASRGARVAAEIVNTFTAEELERILPPA